MIDEFKRPNLHCPKCGRFAKRIAGKKGSIRWNELMENERR